MFQRETFVSLKLYNCKRINLKVNNLENSRELDIFPLITKNVNNFCGNTKESNTKRFFCYSSFLKSLLCYPQHQGGWAYSISNIRNSKQIAVWMYVIFVYSHFILQHDETHRCKLHNPTDIQQQNTN